MEGNISDTYSRMLTPLISCGMEQMEIINPLWVLVREPKD